MPRNGAPAQVRHPLILAYLRAHRHLAPATLGTTRASLNVYAKWCEDNGIDLLKITGSQVDDFLDHLESRKLSVVTVNVYRDRMRWLYAWAVKEGELGGKGKKGKKVEDPMLKVNRRSAYKPIQPDISDDEYAQMQKACDKDPIGRRNAAILSLLRFQGLRRSEVRGLDLSSYSYGIDGENATMVVGTAQHRTKNKRDRLVPLHPDTVDKLESYLRKRGEDDGPLFLSTCSEDGRLTPSGISQIISGTAKKAGLGRSVGVHEFRRAWAMWMERIGVTTADTMDAAGWSDPTMFIHYTRANRTAQAHAAIRKAWEGAEKKTYRPRLRRVV